MVRQEAKQCEQTLLKRGPRLNAGSGLEDRPLRHFLNKLLKERLFGGKVVVERAGGNVQSSGYLAHGERTVPVLREQIKALCKQLLAIDHVVNNLWHRSPLHCIYIKRLI